MRVNIKQYNSKTTKAWGQKESYCKGPKRPRPVYAEGLRGVEKEVWLKRRTLYNENKWMGLVEHVKSEDYGFGEITTTGRFRPGDICQVVRYEISSWGESYVIVDDKDDCEITVRKEYFKPVNATDEEIQYAIIEKEIYGKVR